MKKLIEKCINNKLSGDSFQATFFFVLRFQQNLLHLKQFMPKNHEILKYKT